MSIEFTDAQKKVIAENIGFPVEYHTIMEDDLQIFTNDGSHRAEASLYIDFKNQSIYVTVFYIDGYLDGKSEKKFKINF